MFASVSERIVARLRKDLFSHLINQVSPSILNSKEPYICLSHCTSGFYGFKFIDLTIHILHGVGDHGGIVRKLVQKYFFLQSTISFRLGLLSTIWHT